MAKKKAENTEVAEIAQEAVLPVAEEAPVKKTKKAPVKKKAEPAPEIAADISPEFSEGEEKSFDDLTDDDLFADEELDDAAIEAQLEAAADALDPNSIDFGDEDFEEDLEDITNMKVPDDAYASGNADDYSKDDQDDDHYRPSSHGDPVAVDFPDGIAVQFGFDDLKNMVPAAAFHIGILPNEADQLQTAEMEGGECIFDAGFEKHFCVPDAAVFEGAADHCAVIFHREPPYSFMYALSKNF